MNDNRDLIEEESNHNYDDLKSNARDNGKDQPQGTFSSSNFIF